MSWSSGGRLAEEIWNAVEEHIPEDKKPEVALAIVKAFEDRDCDTMEYYDFYHLARPTCFISGHLDLTPEEFDEHYRPRIDEMIERGCRFVVGDARGADTMAQDHLLSRGCKYKVMVYHMFDKPRYCAYEWWDKEGGWESDEERDAVMTQSSDVDIAWVRPGREESGTARSLERRKQK